MTQREALDLLERATSDLPLDLHSIVAGSVRRGRIRRRHRRIRTTLAAAAAAGAVGLGVAVMPLGGGGGGEVAIEPTVGPSETTAPSPSIPAARTFSASAKDFPYIVARLADIEDVEGPLRTPDYPFVDDATGHWIAHFRLDGMLVSVMVYRVSDDQRLACQESYGPCREVEGGWIGSTAGAPQGGVSSNYATLWRGDYEIALRAYNAADSKHSRVLSERPPLTPEEIEEIVLNDVWFS